MNWQQIILIIVFSPIIIPAAIAIGCMLAIIWGLEYALTGKFNQKESGGW